MFMSVQRSLRHMPERTSTQLFMHAGEIRQFPKRARLYSRNVYMFRVVEPSYQAAMSAFDVGAPPSSMVQSLREHRKELSKQIGVLRAADEVMRRKSRRRGCFGITQYQERLVSTIYVLSNCSSRPAAHKLLQLRSSETVPLSLAQAEQLAEDIFLSMPEHFSAHVWNPPDTAMRCLCSAAHGFLAEHEMFSWVEMQNVEHGVAPGSVAARSKYEEFMLHGVTTKLLPGDPSISSKHARQWVRRWRRRWQVKRGKIQKVEPLQPGEIEAKAAQISDGVRHFFGRNL